MRVVSKIEAKKTLQIKRKRVAAYARISEEKVRTLHSLSAQISYYSNLIQMHREWEYAGVYADSGISGTNDNRAEFRRMLTDCEAGKIDIILTKSISRFARNTVDLLETVRHLRELEIDVRFEKERINSLSEGGELMLTLLASFAQEESRSISENVKWAIRKRFEKGKPNSFNIYGYRWKNEHFEVVPEEAEVVRLIYANFLAGLSAEETERQMEQRGIKSYSGEHFGNTSIRAILRNEKYTGNSLLQKTYTESHLTHKCKVNRGEVPMYFAEGTHPVIIDQVSFDKVQAEIARRRELGVFANWSINTSCFTSKIKCGNCGVSYRRSHRNSRNRKDDGDYCIWVCQTKDKEGKKTCPAKDIPETALVKVCSNALNLSGFDEGLFAEQVQRVTVLGKDKLAFLFSDGREETITWKSTAKADWWTPDRRKAWGELHKCRDTNPSPKTTFTGFIKCGICGENYRGQTRTLKDGTKVRAWRCNSKTHAPSGKQGIEDDTLKCLIAEVLSVSEFDENTYTDRLENVTAHDGNRLIFRFRDGHEVEKTYRQKKRAAPWTAEQRERFMATVNAKKENKLNGKNSNDHTGID